MLNCDSGTITQEQQHIDFSSPESAVHFFVVYVTTVLSTAAVPLTVYGTTVLRATAVLLTAACGPIHLTAVYLALFLGSTQ